MSETVAVQFNDIDDVRQVLLACLTYFQAEDLQRAQVAFSAARPSPLAMEIERLHTRFHGYMGDYFMAQHEAELDEDDYQDMDSTEEAPNGSEPGEEGFGEELSDHPLGEFNAPRQEGRRLSVEEVAGLTEEEVEADIAEAESYEREPEPIDNDGYHGFEE